MVYDGKIYVVTPTGNIEIIDPSKLPVKREFKKMEIKEPVFARFNNGRDDKAFQNAMNGTTAYAIQELSDEWAEFIQENMMELRISQLIEWIIKKLDSLFRS